MRFNKLAFVAAALLSGVLFLEVAAHADEADQSTSFTFNKPIVVPGQTLPAGTYVFKLLDANDLNVVEILNADRTQLLATLETISTQRPEPTGATVVTLADQGPKQPEALVKWYYPGETTGHEFVYSKHEEQQLAQDQKQTIAVKESAEAGR